MTFNSTYHQVFKFPVKLFELARKFLKKNMSQWQLIWGQHMNHFQSRRVPTSQVWFNLHTAGLLSPITIAKKAFRFLYSLQLLKKDKKRSWQQIQMQTWVTEKCEKRTESSYWAAILMNFLRSCTLLLSWEQRHTSVITQNWISLNLLKNRSRFTVVFLTFCLPNVW